MLARKEALARTHLYVATRTITLVTGTTEYGKQKGEGK
jgi:hypothetical protein